MAWRKWLVRGLVFSVLGLPALAAVAYQAWTNPAAVRAQVLAQVRGRFVDDARQRQPRLGPAAPARRHRRQPSCASPAPTDWTARTSSTSPPPSSTTTRSGWPAAPSPSARWNCTGRSSALVRERDGRCNLERPVRPRRPQGAASPPSSWTRGPLVLEDRTASPRRPAAGNQGREPDGRGGPARRRHRRREPGAPTWPARSASAPWCSGSAGDRPRPLDLTAVPVGPDLVQRLAAFCPDAAAQVRQLRGDGAVHASVAYHPASAQPFTYDATCRPRQRRAQPRPPAAAAGKPRRLRPRRQRRKSPSPTAPPAPATPAWNSPSRTSFRPRPRRIPSMTPCASWTCSVDHLPVTADLFQQHARPRAPAPGRRTGRPASLNVTHTFRRDGPGKLAQALAAAGRRRHGGRVTPASPTGWPASTGPSTLNAPASKTMTTDVDLTGYAATGRIARQGQGPRLRPRRPPSIWSSPATTCRWTTSCSRR